MRGYGRWQLITVFRGSSIRSRPPAMEEYLSPVARHSRATASLASRSGAVTLPPVVAQALAAISLGLLGVAGIAKLIDPDPTSGALKSARLPFGRSLARALGAAEVLVAMAGLAVGGSTVVPAAILYLGFALFTLSAVLGRRPMQSCGCFGRDDTPPSWFHVGYNVVAIMALTWVGVAGSAVIVWNAPALELLAYLAFVSMGTYGAYLLLSMMPRTLALVNGR